MSKTMILDTLMVRHCDDKMTRDKLLSAFRRRFKQKRIWAAMGIFLVAWGLVRLAMGWRGATLAPQVMSLVLFTFGHIFLSPLPWQWTKDDKLVAGMWRGTFQALPWNLLWLSLVVLSVHWLFPLPIRHFHPFPGAQVAKPFLTWLPNKGAFWIPLLINLPFAMVLGWFLADRDRAEKVEIQLREKERLARTQALQSQLHPHALYNVLSGLTELVHEDPDAAEMALVKLAELLRTLTRHGSQLRVPLGEERALVQCYLEIEGIRLDARLSTRWVWPDWANALCLPPLLLQPLVENAIKHGISPHPEGGHLEVSVRQEGDQVVLRVANTGMPLDTAGGQGVGIENLQERLALMTDIPSRFSLINEEDWTVAELRLKLQV